jgi:hypothetical protein
MRRWQGIWAALALVVLLTGCGRAIPFIAAAPRPDAVPVDAVMCGDETGPVEDIVAGNVPDGFDPVAVQRCTLFASRADHVGTWSGPVNERLEGDLTELLAALAEPDEAPTMGPCTADMWMGPELWLADAAGRYIRVPYPMGSCPKPRPDVLERIEAALASLTVTEETFVRQALVESDAATAAGCPTTAGMLVSVSEDVPGSGMPLEERGDGVPPVAAIPWEPPTLPDPADVGGMRLCRYEVGVPSSAGGALALSDAGTYAEVDEVDATRAGEILALFAAAPAAGTCGDTASALVLALPVSLSARAADASAALTIELDGCGRVAGPDLQARSAPAALLALLRP